MCDDFHVSGIQQLTAAQQLALAKGEDRTKVEFAGPPIDAVHAPHKDWAGRALSSELVRDFLAHAESLGTPVQLTGFLIADTFALSCRTFRVSIRFSRCRFDAGIEVDNSNVPGLAITESYIGNTADGASITGRFAKIAGDLELNNCVVDSGIDFSAAEVAGETTLDGTVVSTPGPGGHGPKASAWSVDLTNSTLRDLHAREALLFRGLNIAGASLMQLSIRNAFLGPSGTGKALWAQRTTFSEDVLADHSTKGKTPLTAAVFDGAVDFYGAKVSGSVRLHGTTIIPASDRTTAGTSAHAPLDFVLRFSHAQIIGDLALTSIELPRGGVVCLDDATVGHLERSADVWQQASPWEVTSNLSGLTYTRIDTTGEAARTWVRSSRSPDPGSYLALAKAASAEGNRSDELRANIAASERAARWFEILLFGWVRYGFRPYLVGLPLLFFGLICFAQVNGVSDDARAFAPVVIEGNEVTPSSCKESQVACVEPWLYAADSIIPLDLGQVSTWRPSRDDSDGDRLANIIVINEIAGWLLAGVFVAAIAGKLNRT